MCNSKKAIVLAVLGLMVGAAGQARAGQQLILNGDFETGSFNAWTVGTTQTRSVNSSSPASYQANLNDGKNSQVVNGPSGDPAWYLRNQIVSGISGTNATPISGYSAFNSFDGQPGYYFLQQGFDLKGPLAQANLGFTFGIQSSYSGQDRVLTANVLDSGGTFLESLYSYSLPQGNQYNWSITPVSKDVTTALNSLGAGHYQLQFSMNVPQFYTGPAQFAIDNISLNVDPAAIATPEPSTIVSASIAVLMGLGYGWRRRRAGLAA